MAWSVSATFEAWQEQTWQVSGTGYTGVDSDTVMGALFNNTTAPDKTVTVASTGFNTGVWVTANEVTDATNWVSGGRALSSKTFTSPSSGVFMFDAADLAGGGNVTLTNAYGVQVYDNTITAGTVAKQGISFHYLGGPQSVTAGTMTIVWSANGLVRITV
jgi:hypothetical protein